MKNLMIFFRLQIVLLFNPVVQIISGSINNELDNEGDEFCIGFMKLAYSNSNNNFFLPHAIVSTSNNVSLVNFTILYTKSIVAPPVLTYHQTPYNVYISVADPQTESDSYSDRNKGICFTVVAEEFENNSISVIRYILIESNGATASFLALPYQELATDQYEYYTLSTSSSSDLYYSGFLLVGLRDNTSITIYPSIPLNITEDTQKETSGDIEVLPGQSHTVILHRRQTLYIGKDGGADVTGTRIVSDKPLTVISGHEAGSVPSNGTLEPMAQQIPPTQLWGDTFMIVPMKGHSLGLIIKVLSSVDNTKITHKCYQFSNSSVVLTKAGSIHEFYVSSTVSCYIKANNSVLVAQFPYSPNGNSDGDTTMILVASIDQYSNEFNFWALNSSNDGKKKQNINIIVEGGSDHEDILCDGAHLKCEWKPIYDIENSATVGYGCGLGISHGYHRISHHHDNAKLFVMVYGFNTGRAYGYPAGLTFSNSKALGISFSSDNYHIYEGNGTVYVIINRLTHLNYTDTYHLNTSNTTNAETRFVPVSKDIQFSPMESTISVSIIINDNAITDGNEYFTVQLCRSTDPLKDVCIQTEVTILDDDVLTVGIIDCQYTEETEQLTANIDILNGTLSPIYSLYGRVTTTIIDYKDKSYTYNWTSEALSSVVDKAPMILNLETVIKSGNKLKLIHSSLSLTDTGGTLLIKVKPNECVLDVNISISSGTPTISTTISTNTPSSTYTPTSNSANTSSQITPTDTTATNTVSTTSGLSTNSQTTPTDSTPTTPSDSFISPSFPMYPSSMPYPISVFSTTIITTPSTTPSYIPSIHIHSSTTSPGPISGSHWYSSISFYAVSGVILMFLILLIIVGVIIIYMIFRRRKRNNPCPSSRPSSQNSNHSSDEQNDSTAGNQDSDEDYLITSSRRMVKMSDKPLQYFPEDTEL